MDFDYVEVMARVEMRIPYDEVGLMSWGRYLDQYQAYKYIYNFHTKGTLYADIEKEIQEYQQAHRKIDSIFDI